MGLGLHLTAPRPASGLFAPSQPITALMASISQSAKEFAGGLDPVVERWFRLTEDADVVYLWLCPAEEPACVTIGPHRVTMAAKSSSAGPGYHATLVDLLDHLRDERRVAVDIE